MNFVRYLLEKKQEKEKFFVVGDRESLTYGELTDNLEKITSILVKRFGTGKKILLMADNSLFFIISYLAIMYSDNIVVLVETRISQSELADIVTAIRPSGAFIQKKYRDYFEKSSYEIMDESILVEGRHCDDILLSGPDEQDNDTAVIIFTSGSTGTKKGVMLTHKNLIANTSSIIEYLNLKADDRICVALPFFYCYGASLLHTHLRAGGSIVLSQKPFLGSVLNDIDTFHCTGFAGVPSTYQILMNKTRFLQEKLPSLTYFTQAGGQLPDRYIKTLTDSFPEKKVFIMYGATEATARLSYLPPELVITKMGSIGKGIPGVTLRVLNRDMLPVKPSEIGEIVARGENIMKGYYHDPEGTNAVLKNDWLFTGDLATVDEDGFIYIVGRAKNIIKSGGYRVSPTEIEKEILSLEKCKECVVFGMPDDVMGEAVIAVIQSSDSSNQADLRREIITCCNKNLPSYKVPKNIFFIDEFPLNSSRKIDIMKVKEMILSRCE